MKLLPALVLLGSLPGRLPFPAPALALAPGPAPQEGKIELCWKWQKGQEFIYKATKKSVIDLATGQMVQEESTRYSMNVTDVSEAGEATLTMTYLAVGTRGAGPLGEYAYDSDKEKDAPAEGPGQIYARLPGLSFTLKMSPSGRVTDVAGFDRVLDRLLEGAGKDVAAVRAQLKPTFSNEAFKATMQRMAPPLPEGKVAQGDSWANEFVMKMPVIGDMTYKLNSTLSEIKDQTAHIAQDLKVVLKEGGPVGIRDAQGKASSVHSIARGCILSQTSALEMTMVVSQNGQELPMKIVMTLTLLPGR